MWGLSVWSLCSFSSSRCWALSWFKLLHLPILIFALFRIGKGVGVFLYPNDRVNFNSIGELDFVPVWLSIWMFPFVLKQALYWSKLQTYLLSLSPISSPPSRRTWWNWNEELKKLKISPFQDIREICLKKWEVPNEMRKRRLRERPMETAERLLNSTLFRGA